MSVLIHDMDIPETCSECPFLQGHLSFWCWLTEKKLYMGILDIINRRHKDCPIKQKRRIFNGKKRSRRSH